MSIRHRLLHPRARRVIWRIVIALLAMFLPLFAVGCLMTSMPGKSYSGALPALTEPQEALAAELRSSVERLAITIGERNIWTPQNLASAADFVADSFRESGYSVRRLPYVVNGVTCENIEAERKGDSTPQEIVVLGAHYDSVRGTVGANDNASGVAALLSIARLMREQPCERTIRFVAFVNEEPPFYHTNEMGSVVYARACRQAGDNIVAMLSMDGIGYFDDAANSQQYPAVFSWFYPNTANFIGFQSNFASRKLLHRAIGTFRAESQFPSEGVALPGQLGVAGMSDHWSFWGEGYQAILISDTLPFRYVHYHTTDDTPDKLDYGRMARVVEGVRAVMRELASAPKP